MKPAGQMEVKALCLALVLPSRPQVTAKDHSGELSGSGVRGVTLQGRASP